MVRAVADAGGPRGVAWVLVALAGLAGPGGRFARAEPPQSSSETRICVHVFDDRNGDTAQQLPDEVGLGGWTVRVPEGRPTGYLATDGNGVACTSVYAGMISVQVPAQLGWAPTSRVALRVRVAAGETTDVHVGFRREDGGAVQAQSPTPPPQPASRQGRLTVGAALPAQLKITSVRVVMASGRVDLVSDPAVPLGASYLPTADVVEAKFWYEGTGGLPSVALVTSTGAVVRMEGTIRTLHVRAELSNGMVYEYDWDAGREWGCPAPSSVRFAPPLPAGRAGEVGRVGLPALGGTIARFRVVTKGGSFDFVAPGPVPTSPEDPVRSEDVAAVHFFSEGEGARASMRLMLMTTSGRVHRVPSSPDDPLLSLDLRMALPGTNPYEFAWKAARPQGGPAPLVVRFTPPR